jgi:DNA-binding MarR family transcriptional regulator
MRRVAEDNAETSRIMLGLLDAVEQDRVQSQRHLASELGIALGLVNAYLKRCMKKGLVKVRQAPARRFAYYLTPQGFAEKSRLTVEYLSYSFSFFREAKTDCSELFRRARLRGVAQVLLLGQSDLAEIAALCALEQGVGVAGLVDAEADAERFIGAPVFKDIDAVDVGFDAALITDFKNARSTCEEAIARFGIERVMVPVLLRVRIRQQGGAAE